MKATLHRREVVAFLLKDRKELLVVAGLGSTAWDITAAGDSPLSFPTWGAMGQAAMIGLGLALAQPRRRVLVVTGDGEMLMGLGALATIGVQRPANLSVVVIDNERYGETGMQATHTAHGVDLAAVARACGFKESRIVARESELAPLRSLIHEKPGPSFAQVKVVAEKLPLALPPHDGVVLKERFRAAIRRASGKTLASARVPASPRGHGTSRAGRS
jgi:thiamine pyrophosphate-dependent acetolactate synthase large subunit-like protein